MKVHFLGIGGSGTSAAAAIAKAQGFEITGCDLDPINEFTKQFDQSLLEKGHSPKHLEGIEILAITPAILSLDKDNPEILAAKKKGIEVLTWQEFLGKHLLKDKFVIAVSGTHGKSTTTAMIAKILEDAGLDPTVILGAIVQSWGTNFRAGKSKYFVIEADEFNNNFLNITPDIAILTNIEFDHPEFFKNFSEYQESFRKFLSKAKLKIIANLSDKSVVEILTDKKSKEYSFPEILDFSKSINLDLPLKVNGDFNKLNALAAFQTTLSINLDAQTIRNSLMNYLGLGRRSEYLGKFKGADIYSDFAHHPTEIKVTIEAARKKYPDKRLWVVFQPHMFSRTKALFEDFVKTLQDLEADQVSIIDIYPSREKDTGLVNSKQLVDAINKQSSSSNENKFSSTNKPSVSYLGPKEEVEKFLKLAIRKNDVVFFLGAGDIDKTVREIAAI